MFTSYPTTIITPLLLLSIFLSKYSIASETIIKTPNDVKQIFQNLSITTTKYQDEIVKQLQSNPNCHNDIECIYGISKLLYSSIKDFIQDEDDEAQLKLIEIYLNQCIRLLEYLSNLKNHTLSQAILGRIYSEGITIPHHSTTTLLLPKSIPTSLKYYEKAADNGHHASIYNVGKLLYDTKDYIGSLAYFQVASITNDDIKIQTVAKEAHQKLCVFLSQNNNLSLKEIADLFIFGTTIESRKENEIHVLWKESILSLISFNETFVKSNGSIRDVNELQKAKNALGALFNGYNSELSPLQEYLVLDNINDVLGPLVANSGDYLADAGYYAELLASTALCYNYYAVHESDSACFNGALASAMSYYRRSLKHDINSKRILQIGNQHPYASTHWVQSIQTPRVYHEHITAKPLWNDWTQFSAATKLHQLYQTQKSTLLQELNNVIALQEGTLRGEERVSTEITSDGEQDLQMDGFQRIFTLYIGIRANNTNNDISGAGSWAEFGPLFDGTAWSTERCNIVPSICNTLRNDLSLCSSPTFSKQQTLNPNTIRNLCGSGTIVTILRLRPGTSILPHCGTTNKRLILHFPLVGATDNGIKFVVGDTVTYDYDGGDGTPFVFDDSFEHHVYHHGSRDRFVVLVVLGHPDLKN